VRVMPYYSGAYGVAAGNEERHDNAKAQRRGQEDEKGLVVACRGMGILPMTSHGRPTRRSSCRPYLLPPYLRYFGRRAGTSAGGPALRQVGMPVPHRKLCGFRPDQSPSPPTTDGLGALVAPVLLRAGGGEMKPTVGQDNAMERIVLRILLIPSNILLRSLRSPR
jgi:hypothetical protein